MAGVEISYNNSVIATMTASGTETLDTEGTFLTGNIDIAYTAGASYPTYNGAYHSMISFTFSDTANNTTTSYQAEKDMTWSEFIASEYNTSGFVLSNGHVAYYTYDVTMGNNTGDVLAGDIIVNDGIYYSVSGYGGGSND